MNILTAPLGPVFSHQPVKPGPIVDQIVRLSGVELGLTSTSIENWDGVQLLSAGTSRY